MNEVFYRRFGITSCVDIARYKGGLGLRVATGNVLEPTQVGDKQPDGVALLRVPADVCISSDVSGLVACPVRPPPVSEPSSWPLPLAAHLLWACASHHPPDSPASLWTTYRAALPRPPQLTNLTMFREDELDMLGNPPLKAGALEWQARLAAYYEAGDFTEWAAEVSHRKGATCAADSLTFNALQWAVACVVSRAFEFEVASGDTGRGATKCKGRALVPVMDMANHEANAPSFHTFDAKARVFELRSLQRPVAGAELCISYGRRPNDDLLVQYGFVQPGGFPLSSSGGRGGEQARGEDEEGVLRPLSRELVLRTLRAATDFGPPANTALAEGLTVRASQAASVLLPSHFPELQDTPVVPEPLDWMRGPSPGDADEDADTLDQTRGSGCGPCASVARDGDISTSDSLGLPVAAYLRRSTALAALFDAGAWRNKAEWESAMVAARSSGSSSDGAGDGASDQGAAAEWLWEAAHEAAEALGEVKHATGSTRSCAASLASERTGPWRAADGGVTALPGTLAASHTGDSGPNLVGRFFGLEFVKLESLMEGEVRPWVQVGDEAGRGADARAAVVKGYWLEQVLQMQAFATLVVVLACAFDMGTIEEVTDRLRGVRTVYLAALAGLLESN